MTVRFVEAWFQKCAMLFNNLLFILSAVLLALPCLSAVRRGTRQRTALQWLTVFWPDVRMREDLLIFARRDSGVWVEMCGGSGGSGAREWLWVETGISVWDGGCERSVEKSAVSERSHTVQKWALSERCVCVQWALRWVAKRPKLRVSECEWLCAST